MGPEAAKKPGRDRGWMEYKDATIYPSSQDKNSGCSNAKDIFSEVEGV